jgi:hypothetical protein
MNATPVLLLADGAGATRTRSSWPGGGLGSARWSSRWAVSGTVLSYELGLLWPGLMGIPFALEGVWLFVEGIFTAIYLYGWERLSP